MHQHDACNKKGFDLIVLDTRYVPYICPLILYYCSLIDGLSFPLKAPLILIALRTHDINKSEQFEKSRLVETERYRLLLTSVYVNDWWSLTP